MPAPHRSLEDIQEHILKPTEEKEMENQVQLSIEN